MQKNGGSSGSRLDRLIQLASSFSFSFILVRRRPQHHDDRLSDAGLSLFANYSVPSPLHHAIFFSFYINHEESIYPSRESSAFRGNKVSRRGPQRYFLIYFRRGSTREEPNPYTSIPLLFTLVLSHTLCLSLARSFFASISSLCLLLPFTLLLCFCTFPWTALHPPRILVNLD